MPTEEELQRGFTLGDWDVLPARGEIRRKDHVVRPEPKPFLVLMALARRDGDVVTKDELIDEVWDGRPTADDPILRCISVLRDNLGDKSRPYRYVETLTRRGYRLVPSVRLHTPESGAKRTSRSWRHPLIAWGVAALAAAIAIWKLLPTAIVPVGSIAVLPFENLSGDPDLQYLIGGFKHELVKTLSNIPDVSVKDVQDAYTGMEVEQIADRVGVESVLMGGVQKQGNMLKVNYLLASGGDGIALSSGSLLVSTDKIFAGQEELAGMVRDDLQPESEQVLMSSSRPQSTQGHIRYMQGLYAFQQRGQPGKLEEAMALFEETIALDPGFGPAYLQLGMAYALLPDARGAPLGAAHARALEIVEAGIEADGSISDAADSVVGFVHHKRKNWSLAEEAYQRATTATVVDSTAFNWYALMLASVGRLDDSLQVALKAQQLDPNSVLINSRVAIAYTWIDERAGANENFAIVDELGGSSAAYILAHALMLRRQGRLDEAQSLTSEALNLAGADTSWIAATFAGLDDDRFSADALEAVDRAAEKKALEIRVEVVLRTLLGDLDGALQVANRLLGPMETTEPDFLFLPELAPLRRRPEFLDLLEGLRITRYWDGAGCAWQDATVACPEPL